MTNPTNDEPNEIDEEIQEWMNASMGRYMDSRGETQSCGRCLALDLVVNEKNSKLKKAEMIIHRHLGISPECGKLESVIQSQLEHITVLNSELSELKKSEKTISDAYLRIRTLLDAFDTNYGGENRFEVTENKIKELKKENERQKSFIADLFYNKLGGFYSVDQKSCEKAIVDMIEDRNESIKELSELREALREAVEALKSTINHLERLADSNNEETSERRDSAYFTLSNIRELLNSHTIQKLTGGTKEKINE